MFKKLGVALVAVTLSLGVLTPAIAGASENGGDATISPRWTTNKHTSYPYEGGTWEWGNYGDANIHSDYFHGSSGHGSSCQLDSTFNSSINTAAGYTSYSSVWCPVDHPWTNDSYWYRIV